MGTQRRVHDRVQRWVADSSSSKATDAQQSMTSVHSGHKSKHKQTRQSSATGRGVSDRPSSNITSVSQKRTDMSKGSRTTKRTTSSKFSSILDSANDHLMTAFDRE